MIMGDHMIDDHLKNLIHFKGNKLLYSALHNREVEGYQRINNWKEAAQIFLK
jgi:5'(3')-deoxyribonucleotidase